MTVDIAEENRSSVHSKTLTVRVRYAGALRPFVDPKADPHATLLQLKRRVLDFFKLVEGDANGGTKVYVLALDGQALSDLNASLGSLSKDKRELELNLIERFEQG